MLFTTTAENQQQLHLWTEHPVQIYNYPFFFYRSVGVCVSPQNILEYGDERKGFYDSMEDCNCNNC
jgi:hypothetical protein